jgi:hypothetical protein
MHRKRLRAEDIRDSLLLVSGTIDLRYGGPNLHAGTKSEYGYQFTSNRRSVYVPVFRNSLPEMFEVFDFADPNIQRGQRTSSTVASQALLLMNQPRIIDQCRRAAQRLLAVPNMETSDRIQHAYLQVLARPPTEAEMEVAIDLVDDHSENVSGQSDLGANKKSELNQRDRSIVRWAMLYQTLFQCIDFRYLE